jgi:hypothetical protein
MALPAAAQPTDASRGQLLYATHCVECHTTQMHWRARRQVRDWDSLRAQVRHWQGEARLQWTEQDVDAVARHLNATIYRLPRPEHARAPAAAATAGVDRHQYAAASSNQNEMRSTTTPSPTAAARNRP